MSYLYSHGNYWKEGKKVRRYLGIFPLFQGGRQKIYPFWLAFKVTTTIKTELCSCRKISMSINQCTSNVCLSRLEKSQPHHCVLHCCDYLQQSCCNGHYTDDKSCSQLTGTVLSHSLLAVINLYRHFLFPDGSWKIGWIQQALEFKNTFPKLPIHSVWELWKNGNSKSK